jgi:hypothetical protein
VLTSPRARLAASVALSAGLVVLGHFFAARAVADLGYDSTFYVAMVNGQGATVPGPFKFRLLIPLVASVMPFSPMHSLLLISYLSLFATYLLIIRACDTIGLTIGEAAFGLLAIWGSTWHLYHYWNPYMIDAFALFALSVMILALLRNVFWPFAAAALVGTFGRENTAFLVPAWFATKQIAPTIALIVATIVVIALPRYWLASDGDLTIANAFNSSGTVFLPFIFVRQLHAIWGFVWFIALAGLWFLPRAYVVRIASAFAALFVGAFVASMVATDTGRMFGFLAPVLAIASAQFYAVVRRNDPTLAWILLALIAVQGFFNTPDVMFDRTAWIVGWPRRVFVTAELALGAVIVYRLLRRRGQSRFS